MEWITPAGAEVQGSGYIYKVAIMVHRIEKLFCHIHFKGFDMTSVLEKPLILESQESTPT